MEKKLDEKMPILAMVNGVYAVLSRNPMILLRAGLFPFLLVFLIALWSTPKSWGVESYYALRVVEWGLMVAFWTFYASQLQRFVLKGSMDGAVSFLPKLNAREGKYALASGLIFLPLSAFALWFDQPLFFHQPDILIMGGITALDGVSAHLYASLIVGWLIQLFAFVLPAITEDDPQSIKQLMRNSFHGLRHDFSRLFAASLVVVLPIWVLTFILRLVLHMPFFTRMAMGDDSSALAWNLIFIALETFKAFVGGGLLAMLWALAYGRWRNRNVM
ncbi:membrane hypothetical protein [Candidatus Terasakiella magnetica]|uniref:Transmembrane protein n=1 Tax=Candidatus Terasakiella magnetica TaxID=1867952 RepID=A0A1C3RIP4_9PROT|nr:hypothetical protein [Candidatus Terasakiella magnetica]SCA57084.1 membrane hypothetical protein [Candidatus Terasakiella magnetica]